MLHFENLGNLQEVGKAIFEIRKERVLLQSELSRKSNVSQQQISMIERGKGCSLNNFLKIIKALNASLCVYDHEK